MFRSIRKTFRIIAKTPITAVTVIRQVNLQPDSSFTFSPTRFVSRFSRVQFERIKARLGACLTCHNCLFQYTDWPKKKRRASQTHRSISSNMTGFRQMTTRRLTNIRTILCPMCNHMSGCIRWNWVCICPFQKTITAAAQTTLGPAPRPVIAESAKSINYGISHLLLTWHKSMENHPCREKAPRQSRRWGVEFQLKIPLGQAAAILVSPPRRGNDRSAGVNDSLMFRRARNNCCNFANGCYTKLLKLCPQYCTDGSPPFQGYHRWLVIRRKWKSPAFQWSYFHIPFRWSIKGKSEPRAQIKSGKLAPFSPSKGTVGGVWLQFHGCMPVVIKTTACTETKINFKLV